MGRRPGLKKDITGSMLGSQSPEVQDELDKFVLLILKEANVQAAEKIKNGDFKDLTLKEILKEMTSLFRSIQKPATSLQQINLPSNTQAGQIEAQPRSLEIKKAVSDPSKLAELRARAAKYLEGQEGAS